MHENNNLTIPNTFSTLPHVQTPQQHTLLITLTHPYNPFFNNTAIPLIITLPIIILQFLRAFLTNTLALLSD
ncbi:hypothetical protein, partial [Paenibacillus sp. Y412MC10]|uniref:hypothetical protein n=1 Tax=Geobacillus sp. (strain Y412MC10) TaxID=481743 RepID=UPI0021B2E745